MIQFERFTLSNGLKVIVHEDDSTPMAAINILYNVGSKDESPDKTGFAHLFEHLMFGGSENIPEFDEPIQYAGGESNAFTNSDMTNFYDIVPADNIETVFWLESDRMRQLNFSEKSLDTQRKVVVEEFKETCLNKPYGDVWHHLSELAFKEHPYRWPTIGLLPKHVEDATLEDVKAFFYKYYRPNNAILSIAGNVKTENVLALAEKWFGDIPKGDVPLRQLPIEPQQTALQHKDTYAKVPMDSLYLAFHMPARDHQDYHAIDLLSDVLCNGQSSRLYRRLLREQKLFSEIDCYISGNLEPGLLIIEGKPVEGVSLAEAETAVWVEIEKLKSELISAKELQKLKNKIESTLIFTEASVMHKAMNLAYFELLGNAHLINEQGTAYQKVTVENIQVQAQQLLRKENCSELYYYAEK